MKYERYIIMDGDKKLSGWCLLDWAKDALYFYIQNGSNNRKYCTYPLVLVRGQKMSNKNEVFEYLIDQLRQQVNNNQCEDLAHEVQSLKNQLRDASALVAELQEDNIKKSEHISHLTGQVKELHMALAQATGDVEAYKLIRKGGHISVDPRYVVGEHGPGPAVNCRCTPTPVPPEQSGCRKEDTQEWPYRFYYVVTDGSAPFGTKVCKTCGGYF